MPPFFKSKKINIILSILILSSKFTDRNLFSGYLSSPFADPSHKLRASVQDCGSGLRFKTASYSVILRERKRPKNLHSRPFGLRLRVTGKKKMIKKGHSFAAPSHKLRASAQDCGSGLRLRTASELLILSF